MGTRLWDCCYTVAGGASCVGHRCGLGLERYRPPPVSQTIAAPGMCSNKLCLYNIAIIALAAHWLDLYRDSGDWVDVVVVAVAAVGKRSSSVSSRGSSMGLPSAEKGIRLELRHRRRV